MTEERLTRQEEHSENDGTARPQNTIDSMMKELVQMRKETGNFTDGLDITIFDAKAKKRKEEARGSVHLSILSFQ